MSGEEQLAGGIANAGRVTRLGNVVFRPSNAHSPSIHRFLSALRSVGFAGASEPLGIDDDGRERVVFIPGDVPLPPYPAWAQADDSLASIAALMRDFHTASATFVATPGEGSGWSTEMSDPAGGSVVCHNDVCLENVVFRRGRAVGLLDFDFASPGRAIYDLAQMARMCVPVDDDVSALRLGWQPVARPARLRLVADVYGLNAPERSNLVVVLGESIARGGEFVRRRVEAGDRNFIEMWNAIGGTERFDRRRSWWAETRAEFASELA